MPYLETINRVVSRKRSTLQVTHIKFSRININIKFFIDGLYIHSGYISSENLVTLESVPKYVLVPSRLLPYLIFQTTYAALNGAQGNGVWFIKQKFLIFYCLCVVVQLVLACPLPLHWSIYT